MRIMCGSDLYADVEAAHRAELLSRLCPEDGLYYNLARSDRPWSLGYNPAFDGKLRSEDLSNVGGCGRMLRALVTWRELEDDPALDRHIRALVLMLPVPPTTHTRISPLSFQEWTIIVTASPSVIPDRTPPAASSARPLRPTSRCSRWDS